MVFPQTPANSYSRDELYPKDDVGIQNRAIYKLTGHIFIFNITISKESSQHSKILPELTTVKKKWSQ
jgi:hypothetical protein